MQKIYKTNKMIKTNTYLISSISVQFLQATIVLDSVDVKNLVPYSWTPISDVDKVTEFAEKDIQKEQQNFLLQLNKTTLAHFLK